MAALIGIDFSRDGKQSGHLAIPYSSHASAYGKIVVPIVYIKNGEGPSALISAGVHGDEFEGQIALRNLCLDLGQDDINGSVVILPMANAPAVLSSSRVSPIDHLNLNRMFPGNLLGSPTEMMANAIENLLMDHCDFAYDIHSGGSSLLYDTVAVTTATGSREDDEKRLNLLRSLGLGAGMLLPSDSNMGFESSTDGAMLRKNVIGVSAEFGGAGVLSPDLLEICEKSIRGFLAHVGILPSAAAAATAKHCDMYDVGHPDAHVFSDCTGIFKPEVSVGANLAKGETIGRIYDFYDLLAPPKLVMSDLTGMVLALRTLPRTQVGDCLAQIGRPT
jgi:predicted deacylase